MCGAYGSELGGRKSKRGKIPRTKLSGRDQMANMRVSPLSSDGWEQLVECVSKDEAIPDPVDREAWTSQKEPMAALTRAIERKIIPNLLSAHPKEPVAARNGQSATLELDPKWIAEFTQIILYGGADEAVEYAKSLLAKGLSLEALYLKVFATTARRLGEFWVEDICDFSEVTIGVGRLQQLIREFSHESYFRPVPVRPGRRVLLSPTPGEQHTFGILMVAEFFRKAGWDVTGLPDASGAELCTLVRGEWFALVGFSLSAEKKMPELTRAISAVRKASCNTALAVVVGGRVFADQPDLFKKVGADDVASDGRQAVRCAEALCEKSLSIGT